MCGFLCECMWVCVLLTTKMRDGKQRTWQLLAPAWWWWLWLPSVVALSSQFSRGDEYEDRKSPIIQFYFIINFITHKVKRRSRAASWWCTRLSTWMKNGNNNIKERKLERKRHTHTHGHTRKERCWEARIQNTRPFGRKSQKLNGNRNWNGNWNTRLTT